MKLTVLICLGAVATALAAPPARDFDNKDVKHLSYENENNENNGEYEYGFSQLDGSKRKQRGRLGESNTLIVSGSFSWVAPNSHIYTVTYVADDNGYQTDMKRATGLDPALVASLLG